MLKVECESCKAPYQVDERRVPPTGLKMRCPKCGHTFKVTNPNAPAVPAAASPPAAPPRPQGAQSARGSGDMAAPISGRRAPTIAGLGYGKPVAPVPLPALPDVDDDPFAELPAPKGGAGRAGAPPAPPPGAPAGGISTPLAPAFGGGGFGEPDFGAPLPAIPAAPARPAAPMGTQPPPFGSPARGALPGLPAPDDDPFGPPPGTGGFGAPDDLLGGGFGSLDDLPMPAGSGAGLPSLSSARSPLLNTQPSASPRQGPPPAPPAPAPPFAPQVRAPAETRDFGSDFGSFADLGGGSLPSPAQGHAGGDFGSLDDDLPMMAAELPAARRGPPGSPHAAAGRPAPPLPSLSSAASARGRSLAAPPTPAGGFGEIDLPSVTSGANLPALSRGDLPALSGGQNLPALAGGNDLPAAMDPERMMPAGRPRAPFSPFDDLPQAQRNDQQLPVVQSALPALQSALPVVQSALPAIQSSLPAVQGSLPALQGSLPALQGSLPALQGSLPALTDAFPSLTDALPMQQNALPERRFDSFGEFELPREGSRGPSAPPGAPSIPPGLGGSGGSGEHRSAGSAMGFGEVDLGSDSDDDDGGPSIGTEEPLGMPPPRVSTSSAGMPGIGTEVAIGGDPGADKLRRRASTVVIRRSSSRAPRVLAILVVLGLVGGAALQATSAGAFGWKLVNDTLHQKDYDQLMQSTASSARRRMGVDTWADFRGAVDDLAASHASTPRARDLTAYAALAAYETELRFGSDGPTDARAKAWLAELGEKDSRYAAIARAAGQAVAGDTDKARAGFQSAGIGADDPVQQDVALATGELEILAKKPGDALKAFTRAATLAPSARAQFGLARAYYAGGDLKSARTALANALTFNKSDAGALLLRASIEWKNEHDGDAALTDLSAILDGAAASSASPNELSQAHALRGYIAFRREHSADARAHFDEALKLNSRNVLALVGQGELLLADQRATEALARFDTALGADPTDIDAIVGDASANMTLDKLTEAKKMLADARAKAPKSMRLALAAGKVEAALGNKAVAETTLKEAITLNETGDPLAIQPYLVLAELLAGEGKVDEAQKALDDARAKLPDSLEMQRALGDVAAAQGHFDQAVTHYQAAMAKDPKDLRTHYRYAITLRKMGKGDEASAELDQVAAGDKDYPGLALERGLLFEETGQSDKALDMFQNALKKSPNDPDLQLRVGAAYVASNHPDEAIAMLKKVLELRTNSAEANHYMGRAYLEKGALHAGEASKFLRRAVDLDPNRAEYHLYIAWQANDAEPPELGIVQAEVTKALSLDATLADAYWQRGVLERKTLRIDDAIKDLKHALELKPSRYQAHATLAECYEEKNQDPLALGEWQKAVAGNDEVPYWRYKLGKLKAIHGDVASAADDLLYATTEAEKLSAHPGWLADAEYMAGSAAQKAGKKSDAIQHYGTFLGMAPLTSPDRKDAIRQLAALGSPWNE
jgi:predicted Zn finger-like uncharacterized protein